MLTAASLRIRKDLKEGNYEALSRDDWQLIAGMHPDLFQIEGQFADSSGFVSTRKYIPANIPSDYILEVLKKAKRL